VLWANIVDAVTYFESGYNPHEIYNEPPPLNNQSVGLLQLSYSDGPNYKLCTISKAAKDLEDPLKNLDCGVKIMAHWVAKDGALSTPQNKGAARYWSTLREKRKLPAVIARVKSAVGC
jgi:hypothetical protein